MTKPDQALITLMRALGVCQKCATPVLLSSPEAQNKAWGFGGCCAACRDGIGAALAMYVKKKPDA